METVMSNQAVTVLSPESGYTKILIGYRYGSDELMLAVNFSIRLTSTLNGSKGQYLAFARCQAWFEESNGDSKSFEVNLLPA
jgi:hypothetical protein